MDARRSQRQRVHSPERGKIQRRIRAAERKRRSMHRDEYKSAFRQQLTRIAGRCRYGSARKPRQPLSSARINAGAADGSRGLVNRNNEKCRDTGGPLRGDLRTRNNAHGDK